jgi:hypothetical protein
MFVGQETIRGFDTRGIGPRVFNGATNVGAAGGTTYFNGTLEVSAPLPAVSREIGLRFNVFADAATLYGNNISAADFGTQTLVGSSMDWRASIGAGITVGLAVRSAAGLLRRTRRQEELRRRPRSLVSAPRRASDKIRVAVTPPGLPSGLFMDTIAFFLRMKAFRFRILQIAAERNLADPVAERTGSPVLRR